MVPPVGDVRLGQSAAEGLEVIEQGHRGFLVADAAEAVEVIGLVSGLARHAIRASTVRRFGVRAMVDRYEAPYRAVLSGGLRFTA